MLPVRSRTIGQVSTGHVRKLERNDAFTPVDINIDVESPRNRHVPRNREPILAIFDHDGVLVDTLEQHQRAWVDLGERENLPITAEFIRATFGRTNPDILRELLGNDAPDDAEIARFGDLKESCYRAVARSSLTLMPGVRKVLEALDEAGVWLAIGSSGPRANLELTVTVCGLDGRFTAIVGLEDITRGKPDPEVFLLAAQRAEVAPSRCVVFEDAPVGIQAARAAGMIAVGVGTTHPVEHLKAAGANVVTQTLENFDVASLLDRFETRGRPSNDPSSVQVGERS